MIPGEFVRFSAEFEVGFLVWISNGKPTMVKTDFSISSDALIIEPMEYDPLRLPAPGTRVTLIFANQWYTERCEMGIVKGVLKKDAERLKIEPHNITWSVSFDVNTPPDRLVKRWVR